MAGVKSSSKLAQSATAGGAPHLEDALVTNLKQQVSCLELELKYLKEQQQQQPTREARTLVIGGPDGSDFHAAHNDLLRHAQNLELEVATLREKYATREKEHALEMASMKGVGEVTGLSRVHGQALSLKEELERRQEQHKHELKIQKDMHADEVVALQKSVERMQIELTAKDNELRAVLQEKEGLVKDLLSVRDNLRSTAQNCDMVNRQYNEAMQHLNSEQEKRRTLEARERDLRAELAEHHNTVGNKQMQRIEELEAKAKDLSSRLTMKEFEASQLRATCDRLTKEAQTMAAERGEIREKTEDMKAKTAAMEEKLAKVTTALTDTQSEREFYRLACDRLKVESAVLEVKVQQLETKANSDRAAMLTLERQHCGSLETIENLRREAKSREEMYRSLDSHDGNIRRENKILRDEFEKLKREHDALVAEHEDISKKYASVKNYADQAKAESQLMTALTKLERTKVELGNLLNTQMRLTQDMSATMYDMPDTQSVTRALTPMRDVTQHMSTTDISVVGPPPPLSAPISSATHVDANQAVQAL